MFLTNVCSTDTFIKLTKLLTLFLETKTTIIYVSYVKSYNILLVLIHLPILDQQQISFEINMTTK